MLSDVIYPLMCHSDADERLWQDDPIEYVRTKYGMVQTSNQTAPVVSYL